MLFIICTVFEVNYAGSSIICCLSNHYMFFPETRADLLKPLVLTCLVAKSTPNQTENVKIQIKEQFDTQLRPVDTSLQPRCTSPLREETRRTRRRWRGVVAAARHSARGVRVTQI